VPGFNGFIGEFLILVGAWSFRPWLVVVASLGEILAAGYVLWMVKRVFYGEANNPRNEGMADLSLREAVVMVPLLALAVYMGVASPVFTRRIEPAAIALVAHVAERTQPAPVQAAGAGAPADCPVETAAAPAGAEDAMAPPAAPARAEGAPAAGGAAASAAEVQK
jgi:NADH-quinone oxidoreductase subunit M